MRLLLKRMRRIFISAFFCNIANRASWSTAYISRVFSSSVCSPHCGGGILTYLFLRRAGYQGLAQGIINVGRNYQEGKPFCELIDKPEFIPFLIIEDILASGQTLEKTLSSYGEQELEIVCLMASSNISPGKRGYRDRNGSTIRGVSRLYCSQLVNGYPNGTTKPAILSLRYLITKALDDKDYNNSYLSRKFGGIEEALKICELVRKVDRQKIDLLRTDPTSFLRDYGIEVGSFNGQPLMDRTILFLKEPIILTIHL